MLFVSVKCLKPAMSPVSCSAYSKRVP